MPDTWAGAGLAATLPAKSENVRISAALRAASVVNEAMTIERVRFTNCFSCLRDGSHRHPGHLRLVCPPEALAISASDEPVLLHKGKANAWTHALTFNLLKLSIGRKRRNQVWDNRVPAYLSLLLLSCKVA